jgi:hypothetical protein
MGFHIQTLASCHMNRVKDEKKFAKLVPVGPSTAFAQFSKKRSIVFANFAALTAMAL